MPVMVESGSGKKKIVDIVMNTYSTINRGEKPIYCGSKIIWIAGK